MAKVDLTTRCSIEELAATRQRASNWRKSYYVAQNHRRMGIFSLLLKLTVQDDDDGDHDTR